MTSPTPAERHRRPPTRRPPGRLPRRPFARRPPRPGRHGTGAARAPETEPSRVRARATLAEGGGDDARPAEPPATSAKARLAIGNALETTTEVHLRLALPHVRAALRQLRNSCRSHVATHAEGSGSPEKPLRPPEVPIDAESRSASAEVAAEISTLTSALMEMDAEALRACVKFVVVQVRRLLEVTAKRSPEKVFLGTLLFSLSRFSPSSRRSRRRTRRRRPPPISPLWTPRTKTRPTTPRKPCETRRGERGANRTKPPNW